MLCSVTRNTTKKKIPKAIKQELLVSRIKIAGDEDYWELNEEWQNAKKPKYAISLVNKYEGLLKGANK